MTSQSPFSLVRGTLSSYATPTGTKIIGGSGLSAEQLRLHFRFLETADESFAYGPEDEVPGQGRWTVSGLDLDPALLPAVYRDNARRFLGL